MANLRTSGPSFGGLVYTLDTTTSTKSNESITEQKHMYRAPTWKTGTDVSTLNAPVTFVPNTSPAQYTHTDFPNTGDQISVSDYRGIVCNIEAGSASFTSGSNKTQSTTTYIGWGTQDGLAAASNGSITSSQIGSALSEGTTYTGLPIPMHTNYGTGFANNVWLYGAFMETSGILQTAIILVFGGSGRNSISTSIVPKSRGNGNLLASTSTGPDGTWNQNNTAVAGGYNHSFNYGSNPSATITNVNTPASGTLRRFKYLTIEGHCANRSTGANFTIRFD